VAKKIDPTEQKQGLMLRLPKHLHTALRHVSIDRATSLNTLITEVLEEWWSRQPERRKYPSRS
jgi:predicted HicB family RNase H-like nuclease